MRIIIHGVQLAEHELGMRLALKLLKAGLEQRPPRAHWGVREGDLYFTVTWGRGSITVRPTS